MAKADSLLSKYRNIVSLASTERKKTYIKIGPMSVNLAIGDIRGIPCGRLVEIIGEYSSSKTTLALDTIATYQQENPDKQVLFVDFERSLDSLYASACGVDLDRLVVVRADTTESGLSIIEEAIKDYNIQLVFIDSIPAAMPSSEEGKDYNDNAKMASNAGVITRFCYRIAPILDNYDAMIVVINQWRANFSTMSHEKNVPYGPRALHFAAAVMLSLTKIKTEDDQQTVQVHVKKNKVGAPQARAEYIVEYGKGIDHAKDILMLAINAGFVQKAGAWYNYGDIKAQGLDNAVLLFPIDEIKECIMHYYEGGKHELE